MYIVEVTGGRYVFELTATTVTYTTNWKRAKRFPVSDLPKSEDLGGETIIGYDPV